MIKQKRPSRKFLIQHLLHECLTNKQASCIYDVHAQTISRWCKYYNIDRNFKYATKLNKKYLKEQLCIQKKSIRQLSKELNIQASVISTYAIRANIHVSKSRSAQKQSEMAAILNDSIREWVKWRIFRQEIFKRDNFKCRICHKPAKAIHHKKSRQDCPKLCFVKSNVISICTSCHMRLHQTRRNKRRNI